MIKKIRVNIPNPCTENWDLMTKTEQGRHCGSCNKVVIDFSGMTDGQIVKILLEQKGKKICGNFYNTQLTKPMLYIQQRSFPKWPAIAAMMVAGLFQLSTGSLNAQKISEQQVYPRQLAIEKNPLNKSDIKTEPASDSLIIYTIKVMDEKTKVKLSGIMVEIDSIGIFVTDKNGEVKLEVDIKKIPQFIHVQFSSWNYEVKDLSLAKTKLSRTKTMQVYLKYSESIMIKGDVDINYNRN